MIMDGLALVAFLLLHILRLSHGASTITAVDFPATILSAVPTTVVVQPTQTSVANLVPSESSNIVSNSFSLQPSSVLPSIPSTRGSSSVSITTSAILSSGAPPPPSQSLFITSTSLLVPSPTIVTTESGGGTTTELSESDGGGLSGGQIAGIVIGTIAGCLLLLFLLTCGYFVCCYQKKIDPEKDVGDFSGGFVATNLNAIPLDESGGEAYSLQSFKLTFENKGAESGTELSDTDTEDSN